MRWLVWGTVGRVRVEEKVLCVSKVSRESQKASLTELGRGFTPQMEHGLVFGTCGRLGISVGKAASGRHWGCHTLNAASSHFLVWDRDSPLHAAPALGLADLGLSG